MKNLAVVLLGAPGIGKGTLGANLQILLRNAKHIIMSDLLKPVVEADPDLQKIKREGGLLPDAIVHEVLETAGLKPHLGSLLVLDGVARSAEQTRLLLNFLAENSYTVIGIHLVCSVRVAIARICNRAKKAEENGLEVREDDKNPDVVLNRLDEYNRNEQPVLKVFGDALVETPGGAEVHLVRIDTTQMSPINVVVSALSKIVQHIVSDDTP
jgi:adenylate kinase family enzyme